MKSTRSRAPHRRFGRALAGGVAAVALALGGAIVIAPAAVAAPVGCTSDFYYTTSPSSANIVKWAPDGSVTTIGTGSFSPQSLAINPVDGYLYGLSNTAAIGNHLFRLQDDGTSTDLGVLVGLPGNTTYQGLGFAADGTGWTAGSKYTFDIGTMTATLVANGAAGDITSLDGMLYGSAPGGRLARIDPTTGTATNVAVAGLTTFGSIWAADGHLYVNQGTLIREILGYDTTAPTLLTVGTSASLTGDGASCATAPSRFLAAIDDDDSATPLATDTGGVTASVLSNDVAAGAAVASANVTVSLVADGGLTGATIDADGRVSAPTGSPAGAYSLRYRVCLVVSPSLCDLATLAVVLQAPPPVVPPAAVPAAPTLPPTGTNPTVPAFAGGAAIIAGALSVLLARRRARADRGLAAR